MKIKHICANCAKEFETMYYLNEEGICLDCEIKAYEKEANANQFILQSLKTTIELFTVNK